MLYFVEPDFKILLHRFNNYVGSGMFINAQ